jgi:hypothetical protein
MKALIKTMTDRENLLPISAGITFGLLVLAFLLAQILRVSGLLNEENPFSEKMQVFEVIRLKFTPQVTEPVAPPTPTRMQHRAETRVAPRQASTVETARKSAPISALAQDFDPTQFLENDRAAGRSGRGRNARQPDAGISTNIQRQTSALAQFDLPAENSALQTTLALSRRIGNGGSENNSQINLGSGGSSLGGGSGSDGFGAGGVDFDGTGNGNGRSRRGKGAGNGGTAQIALPAGSGGGDAALDLHALIKWMKAHPGQIPKLVAHDMGHNPSDLASATAFQMNGRQYHLFLSCNEVELLLRICLVDGQEFTLLKDSGIKETSNFLILGNVVRNGAEIRSLISSRQAPAGAAKNFYRIFWSWWLNEEKKVK